MCTTCGCSQPSEAVTITKIGDEKHDHVHYRDQPGHEHHHHHNGHNTNALTIDLEKDILDKNNLLAQRNRGYFEAKGILALNLVSSPGSGKTSLLERTIEDLKSELPFGVIEGDQQTTNDADRIAQTGAPVIQINTGKGCHLDAEMIHQAVKKLKPSEESVLMIENVGNLVCPAMFDLGEAGRVVIISVTEGDDKPIKYPDMFHGSNLCIINKIDLLPYVKFDIEKAKNYASQVNPHIKFIELSATTGQGLDNWYDWLRKSLKHFVKYQHIH